GWCHPFGRSFVMGAAGTMNVVVARVPAKIGQLDPTPQLESLVVFGGEGHRDLAFQNAVLRTARVGRLELAGREEHRLPIGAVDLVVKEEIGSEPTGP